MKNQVNKKYGNPAKAHNNLPVTDPKEREKYELSNKELFSNGLVNYRKITEKQFSEIQKTVRDQNEKINRDRNYIC